MSQHRRGTQLGHGQDHSDPAPGAFCLNGRQKAFRLLAGDGSKALAAAPRGAGQGSLRHVSDYHMHSLHSRTGCSERASVAPSNIRTLSSLGRESGPFDVVSDEKIGVPIPPSRVSVSSLGVGYSSSGPRDAAV